MRAIKSIVTVTMLIAVLFLVPVNADAPGELQITLLKAKPAVVHVFTSVKAVVVDPKTNKQVWDGYTGGGSGTGFIVNPDGYVVTNGHVVADVHESNEDKMKAMSIIKFIQERVIPQLESENKKRYSGDEKNRMVGKLYEKYKNFNIILKKDLVVLLSNKREYHAEVKEYSPAINPLPGGAGTLVRELLPGVKVTTKTGKDISILKIEDRNFPTAQLGDSDTVQIGETVHVIGYPSAANSEILSQESKMVDQTINTGTISGGKIDIKGTPMIQTDANIIWGNSGGPCINGKGEVIGVASYVGIAQNQAFSGFNWLVPINTAKEFIRANGIDTSQRSLFDTEWEKALLSFQKGDYDDTEEAIKNCLVYMPDQPDARKLLLKLKEIPKPKSHGLTYLIIGLLVVGLGIIFFMLKSKKSSSQAEPTPATPPTKIAGTATIVSGDLGVLVGRGESIENQKYKLTPQGLKIGRDSSKNDIVIDDAEVSREHAWIGPEGDKIIVKDLNSTNGTYINSVSSGNIEKADINPDDFVLIGKAGNHSVRFQKG